MTQEYAGRGPIATDGTAGEISYGQLIVACIALNKRMSDWAFDCANPPTDQDEIVPPHVLVRFWSSLEWWLGKIPRPDVPLRREISALQGQVEALTAERDAALKDRDWWKGIADSREGDTLSAIKAQSALDMLEDAVADLKAALSPRPD